MYEELISFLIDKRDQMTSDDVSEFLRLLAGAFGVLQEFEILNKQSEIQSIIDSCSGIKAEENEFISNALGNILHVDSSPEDDIFNDRSNGEVPLRGRKIKRGNFKMNSPTEEEKEKIGVTGGEEALKADSKRIKLNKDEDQNSNEVILNENTDFEFEIGELEENHSEGPAFDFRL